MAIDLATGFKVVASIVLIGASIIGLRSGVIGNVLVGGLELASLVLTVITAIAMLGDVAGYVPPAAVVGLILATAASIVAFFIADWRYDEEGA